MTYGDITIVAQDLWRSAPAVLCFDPVAPVLVAATAHFVRTYSLVGLHLFGLDGPGGPGGRGGRGGVASPLPLLASSPITSAPGEQYQLGPSLPDAASTAKVLLCCGPHARRIAHAEGANLR